MLTGPPSACAPQRTEAGAQSASSTASGGSKTQLTCLIAFHPTTSRCQPQTTCQHQPLLFRAFSHPATMSCCLSAPRLHHAAASAARERRPRLLAQSCSCSAARLCTLAWNSAPQRSSSPTTRCLFLQRLDVAVNRALKPPRPPRISHQIPLWTGTIAQKQLKGLQNVGASLHPENTQNNAEARGEVLRATKRRLLANSMFMVASYQSSHHAATRAGHRFRTCSVSFRATSWMTTPYSVNRLENGSHLSSATHFSESVTISDQGHGLSVIHVRVGEGIARVQALRQDL